MLEEWLNYPDERINKHIDSMQSRIEACTKDKGVGMHLIIGFILCIILFFLVLLNTILLVLWLRVAGRDLLCTIVSNFFFLS